METKIQITSASVSDRGLSEKRPQNEDSFLEIPEIGLYAVADGVGGAQAGEVASQMAMEILGEAFINIHSGADAEEVMRIAIERANSAIYQMSGDLAQLSMMATTIVALYIRDDFATIGHVGDSRLYRLDPRGSLFRETQDHSVVEEEVRAGRMTAAQAANHPSRNVISRALGAESVVEVDLKSIPVEPGSVFLICSDGVTRHISDFEIRELLISSPSPNIICDRIKAICFDRGAEDNLTAVIVRTKEAADGFEQVGEGRIDDIEEETIATSRYESAEPTMEFAENSVLAATVAEYADSDEQYLIQEQDDEPVYRAFSDESQREPMMSFAADEEPAVEPEKVIHVRTDDDEMPFSSYSEKESGGGIGRMLGWLALLLIGAAIGAGGFFAYQKYAVAIPEVPVLTEKTNNIPQNSVDSLRQDAVTKPAEVIKQYQTAPPKDASDFYVLGKAHFYSKNYDEAKKAFIEARNRLKDVSVAEDRAALAAEITQGLIIAQNKEFQAAFEKEMKVTEPGVDSANSPSNSSREP